MTSPLEIAARDTALSEDSRHHLDRLTATWSLLADLSFSDLLLYVPVTPDGGDETPDRLVVLGQVRPTTSQTLFEIDLVGQVVASGELPLVVEALRTGAISVGEQRSDVADGHLRLECIPVGYHDEVLAAVARVWSLSHARRRGALERVYLELFERFAAMVADGAFPFGDDELPAEHLPRVGDGALVLDERGRVVFASPNAVSALHRIGIMTAMTGSTLRSLGLESSAVDESFSRRLPVVEEIERRADVTLLLRCIPLLQRAEVTGALVLVRDVTDLRRRDRLLLTKDATIREVHHRVKNNLQTISSLLRLQARRIEAPEAKTALAEAERRIGAIAVVHEILSREASDQVPFDMIVEALVKTARDSSVAPEPVTIDVEGELGEIPAEVATPLAVVIVELLQNAVEHAFAAAEGEAERRRPSDPHIDLVFLLDEHGRHVTVHDNGGGLPADFDIEATRSLGLSIVRDLVRTQLGGKITMVTDGGTIVRLDLPLETSRTDR